MKPVNMKHAANLPIAFAIAIAASTSVNAVETKTQDVDMAGYKMILNAADSTGVVPSLRGSGNGRADIGWGGAGGGNLEAYSKSHASRPGEFKFIYGGGASTGKIVFTHYNGSGWSNTAAIDPSGNMFVGGTLNATEVVVQSTLDWPDYVFESDYGLMPLSQIDAYIKENGHLPETPTAADVASGGVGLGEMSATLLKKVEELTLHVIDLEKRNQELSARIDELRPVE